MFGYTLTHTDHIGMIETTKQYVTSYNIGNLAWKFLPADRKSADYEGDGHTTVHTRGLIFGAQFLLCDHLTLYNHLNVSYCPSQ